jgi:hypothetical protein
MKSVKMSVKKSTWTIISVWTMAITGLFFISAKSETDAKQDESDVFFNKWQLDGYFIEGEKYPPSKNEAGDYILFKKDMTFISNVEGNEEEGVFILNTNGSYVLMMDKNGEKVKAHIISKSNKLLHLKYDVDEIRDVEVHYIRSI